LVLIVEDFQESNCRYGKTDMGKKLNVNESLAKESEGLTEIPLYLVEDFKCNTS